ncbi:hypothetical protein Vadar_023602 [Vaccinium darrowii]|uniref:Uncharacterized protein n=1 Tax=Vaccinium darrowii TaxID=229202 RepID=A0ACB7Y8M7_9ERIC|nr:hypothetical protein Vadar_023602 [Vaccinium darrowii]
MNLEELKYPQNNIIHITKPQRLRFLRVMQTPGPIQLDRGPDRTAGGGLVEREEAAEDGTVLVDVEALEVAGVGVVVDALISAFPADPRVLRLISAFLAGHCSFYSDSFLSVDHRHYSLPYLLCTFRFSAGHFVGRDQFMLNNKGFTVAYC